jgi:malate/lactate dehydrogenase
MVDAVARGAEELWPASLVLEGEYGVEGVALSVPVALRDGSASIHAWELSIPEQESFERAAELVREATERVAAELDARVAGGP